MSPAQVGARNVAQENGEGEAALLWPTAAPQLMQSSPVLCDLAGFCRRFATGERRRWLLDRLASRLDELREGGVAPQLLLAGGSIVGEAEEPGDFDGLLFYRLPGGVVDAASLKALFGKRDDGLDLRFVPLDASPMLLVKMSCFFHTLYQSNDKGGGRPSYLVELGAGQ